MKINNGIQISSSSILEFYSKWFTFLKPIIKLPPREINVMAHICTKHYELQKVIKDNKILDEVLFNTESRREIEKNCGITTEHYQVILGRLRKAGLLVSNTINPAYLPKDFKEGEPLNLIIQFVWK